MPTELTADGQNEALVTLIVKEFRETSGGYLGRTAIQKLCYFAQALRVPLGYHFRIYYYGPYSDALSFDIEMLLLSDVLRDSSTDRDRYSNFSPGSDADELLQAHSEVVGRHRPTVRRVAAAFGKLDAQTLELLSTLHFVHRKLQASGFEQPSKESVIADFRQVKQDKFPRDQIERGYKAMESAGLLR